MRCGLQHAKEAGAGANNMRSARIHGDLSNTDEREAVREVRRARRRLIQERYLLTAAEFCRRSGISRAQLARRLKQRTIFATKIGRDYFYPALFARRDRLGSRLARVTRAMSAMSDAWAMFFELAYTFESLGTRTLPQAMRRAVGFRAAMRYARQLAPK